MKLALDMFLNPLTDHPIAQRIRRAFRATPCRLQAAALPWRRTADGVEILLVTSRDTGRWILPKGWPEGDEALCEAAAREAGEEAGLRGRVEPREIGRYFYDKVTASGKDIACEVRVFSLEVGRIADKWKEKGQRRRKWFAPQAAARMVNEPDLSSILAGFSAGSPATG